MKIKVAGEYPAHCKTIEIPGLYVAAEYREFLEADFYVYPGLISLAVANQSLDPKSMDIHVFGPSFGQSIGYKPFSDEKLSLQVLVRVSLCFAHWMEEFPDKYDSSIPEVESLRTPGDLVPGFIHVAEKVVAAQRSMERHTLKFIGE